MPGWQISEGFAIGSCGMPLYLHFRHISSQKGRSDAQFRPNPGELNWILAQVRERFKRDLPSKEISATQRGESKTPKYFGAGRVEHRTAAFRGRDGWPQPSADASARRPYQYIRHRLRLHSLTGKAPSRQLRKLSRAGRHVKDNSVNEQHVAGPVDKRRGRICRQLQVLRDMDLLLHIGHSEWKLNTG